MKNLQYLSDVIGARLTGSKNLERANHWTEQRMKDYGLTNVHLEAWEIPLGWERGFARMRVVEPESGRELTLASAGWSPGTNGKVLADVVIVKAEKKADLDKYKGKLKNTVVLTNPPTPVKPVTDLTYPPPPGPRAGGKQGDAKKDDPAKEEAKKDDPEKEDAKKDDAKKDEQPGGRFGGGLVSGTSCPSS